MTAHISIGNEMICGDDGMTIEEAVLSAGKHPDAFIFLLNGRPVPMTAVLEDGMTVETLQVASGG